MIQQSTAKIFLAEERGMNETKSFRSLHTLNFGNYFNQHKAAIENIYIVNDDTLDGDCSLSMLVQEYSYIILLPVIGAIAYKDSMGNENLIAAGQVQIINLEKGATVEISNPFKEHLVNFMQVWIKAGSVPSSAKPLLVEYDVNECLNSLVKIAPEKKAEDSLPFVVSVGKFNGRGETVYQPQPATMNFLFVLEGAFEAEGRLLHARDGLALWNTQSVEMEALSNDAILLLIETGICNKE